MLISVIVIAYNGEAYLRNCLNSIMDQRLSGAEYEIIYVDNASQDDSLAILAADFPTVRVVAHQQNLGYYGGFNHAATEIAKGDYLVALPQDTILHRDCLAELVKAADEDPLLMVGLVNTINPNAVEYEGRDRNNLPEHVYWCQTNRFGQTNLISREFFAAPRRILAYSGVSALIRRDVDDRLGGYFDERLSHLVGDTELGIRANVLDYHCKVIPTAVVFHIEDNKHITSTAFLKNSFIGARDSVIIYFKLMYTLEFLLFAPFLLVGQATKVFTLRFPRWQRLILFFPALVLSPVTFLLALLRIPEFTEGRREVLSRRDNGYLHLLKTVIGQRLR